MKKWLVASYKINELTRLELNLQNQKFDYYVPKIVLDNHSTYNKKELMFPGYIFINVNVDNYTALKYTKGIKKILQFGKIIPIVSEADIQAFMKIEQESVNNPITTRYKVGQEVVVHGGSFKGNLVKICSLPAGKRVDVFIHLLGSKRKINISLKDITV